MDLKLKWKIAYQSICLIQHYQNGKLIASGTGFKVGNELVTNNHVFFCDYSTHTLIKFVNADSYSENLSQEFSKEEFQALLIKGSTENFWDFAVFDISNTKFCSLPSLMLCNSEINILIGSKIYFLGFPLLQNNLTIHGGNVSSKYTTENGVKYIQIDGSVNSGNSGGALFDYETETIIGIVTRKQTGLTKKFNELKNSVKQNIDHLQQVTTIGVGGIIGSGVIGGIDQNKALITIQAQLDLLTEEIFRSANVGIGYAFELDEVRKYL